jgi:hypothetical protein
MDAQRNLQEKMADVLHMEEEKGAWNLIVRKVQ